MLVEDYFDVLQARMHSTHMPHMVLNNVLIDDVPDVYFSVSGIVKTQSIAEWPSFLAI